MVDFRKLQGKQSQGSGSVDPLDIFRRLPKPPGVNDLYTSQAKVLKDWHTNRTKRDTVIKLHTGGGKTMVGLLIADSVINETGEGALYLVPTKQLVSQTVEKAKALGLNAVEYLPGAGKPLNSKFVNGKAIMVATYSALFNARSKFGLRGMSNVQKASIVIVDDAHAAFSVIRDAFP